MLEITADYTSIPKASLQRVLDGVIVASKTPETAASPLRAWLEAYDATKESSEAQDAHPVDEKIDSEVAHTQDQWRLALQSLHRDHDSGITQLIQVTLAIALLREKARHDGEVTPANIDSIWSLIYDAIMNSRGTAVQFQATRSAQGFFAVPLCSLLEDGDIRELWRFHVWLPDGERGVSDVHIHAHQPFAQSWILAGSGTDYTLTGESTDDPSIATHAEYVLSFMGDGNSSTAYKTHQTSSTVTNNGKLVSLSKVSSKVHTRDMTYTVPAGAYHRSAVPGQGFHATLFFFDAHRGFVRDAAVLGPKDGTSYTQIRDPAGVTPVILAEIANATRLWEQQGNVTQQDTTTDDLVFAYCNFFRGRELSRTGHKDQAMSFFEPVDGSSPLLAFAKASPQNHRDFIKVLVDAGVDLDKVDEAGCRALDYAVLHDDHETTQIIANGSVPQLAPV